MSATSTTRITTPLGGIMTSEGAVSGEVDVTTETVSGAKRGTKLVVRVSYAGSDERYRVLGSPVAGMDHEAVVAHLLTDPGLDADENPASVDLRRTVGGA